jgi:hypothetical protein
MIRTRSLERQSVEDTEHARKVTSLRDAIERQLYYSCLSLGLALALLLLAPVPIEATGQRGKKAPANSRSFSHVPSRGAQTRAVPVIPPFPQFYIKAQDGSAIPVTPVFVVPVAPPVSAPRPRATAPCQRFFCE